MKQRQRKRLVINRILANPRIDLTLDRAVWDWLKERYPRNPEAGLFQIIKRALP